MTCKHFLWISIFLFQQSFAQTLVFQNKSSQTKSEVLYNSIYNEVVVMMENTPCADINLKGENLDIKKGNNCSFYLKVVNPYKSYRVSIYKKDDSITTQNFLGVNNEIPLPTLSVGCGINEYGPLLCSRADSIYCIPVLSDHFNSKIHFKVASFVMTLMRDGDEVIYKEFIVGNRISQKGKDFIKNLKQFDRMMLTQILIVDGHQNYYTIENMEFTAF